MRIGTHENYMPAAYMCRDCERGDFNAAAKWALIQAKVIRKKLLRPRPKQAISRLYAPIYSLLQKDL